MHFEFRLFRQLKSACPQPMKGLLPLRGNR
jgi:hypothetical protein